MLEEFLTMTLKGITRTCYGSVFSDEEQIRKMSHVYQKVVTEFIIKLYIGMHMISNHIMYVETLAIES